MTHLNRLYGLDVASPYDLGPKSPAVKADISISVCQEATRADHAIDPEGRLCASRQLEDKPLYALYSRDDGSYFYRFHDLADVEISGDLSSLRCQFVEGAPHHLLPIILGSHMLATLMLLQGELVLHASAVERSGRAIAFVGGSGGGKSTLAAMTCLAGARLVTDDVLRVTADDGGFCCYRGGQSLRLRPTSKALAQIVDELSDQTADGRHLFAGVPTDSEILPLDGIFLPKLVEAGDPLEARRLGPKDAMLALLQYPRVLNWIDAGTAGLHFMKLAAIADTLPVHELSVPWGVDRDQEFFDSLAALVFDQEQIHP